MFKLDDHLQKNESFHGKKQTRQHHRHHHLPSQPQVVPSHDSMNKERKNKMRKKKKEQDIYVYIYIYILNFRKGKRSEYIVLSKIKKK
mmetsp:Transcript_26764/g.37741  ORF Transcript_26764/g.37741 Transcript_26764/m.37741 type:complete len:88 (-) Transcript_26764:84-347(-)